MVASRAPNSSSPRAKMSVKALMDAIGVDDDNMVTLEAFTTWWLNRACCPLMCFCRGVAGVHPSRRVAPSSDLPRPGSALGQLRFIQKAKGLFGYDRHATMCVFTCAVRGVHVSVVVCLSLCLCLSAFLFVSASAVVDALVGRSLRSSSRARSKLQMLRKSPLSSLLRGRSPSPSLPASASALVLAPPPAALTSSSANVAPPPARAPRHVPRVNTSAAAPRGVVDPPRSLSARRDTPARNWMVSPTMTAPHGRSPPPRKPAHPKPKAATPAVASAASRPQDAVAQTPVTAAQPPQPAVAVPKPSGASTLTAASIDSGAPSRRLSRSSSGSRRLSRASSVGQLLGSSSRATLRAKRYVQHVDEFLKDMELVRHERHKFVKTLTAPPDGKAAAVAVTKALVSAAPNNDDFAQVAGSELFRREMAEVDQLLADLH